MGRADDELTGRVQLESYGLTAAAEQREGQVSEFHGFFLDRTMDTEHGDSFDGQCSRAGRGSAAIAHRTTYTIIPFPGKKKQ